VNRYDSVYNLATGPSGSLIATTISVTAESMEDGVRFMTVEQGEEPVSIELVETGAIVVGVDNDVTFTTTISPAGAITAGAVATPTSYSVIPGTVVIFEATEPTGYTFSKWTKDTVDAGTSLIQEIEITTDATAIVAEFIVTP